MFNREALEQTKFWDAEVEEKFQEIKAPAVDAALQIREEAVALCEWMEQHSIRSYLELGSWTGRFVTCLHRAMNFKKVAACDLGTAGAFQYEMHHPLGCEFFLGNTLSPIFLNWRQKLGPIDLVLIDTDHKFDSTARNVQINAAFGAKYIAMCGISNQHRGINGVRAVWDDLEGEKVEILRPHTEAGFDYSTIGIGIWTVEEPNRDSGDYNYE